MMSENQIHVQVKATGLLKELSGDRIALKSRSSIQDCLNIILAKAKPNVRNLVIDQETGHLSSYIGIVVNGSLVEKLETELDDGDELSLFIVISGG